MKIAIQGELGSFSHQAALRSIPDATVIPCVLSADAFERLRKGEVDAIMIPIENSLAGSVVEHYDLLREHSVFIEREIVVRIEHNVIGIGDSNMEEVQRVYSHPVALAQCRSFFLQHPGIEPIAFYDTAGAVKQIIQLRERHSAAIAGKQAAEIYGGVVLVEGVEDNSANFTRFFLVREGTPATHSRRGSQVKHLLQCPPPAGCAGYCSGRGSRGRRQPDPSAIAAGSWTAVALLHLSRRPDGRRRGNGAVAGPALRVWAPVARCWGGMRPAPEG